MWFILFWLLCGTLSFIVIGFSDWYDGTDLTIRDIVSGFVIFHIFGPFTLILTIYQVIYRTLPDENMIVFRGRKKKPEKTKQK